MNNLINPNKIGNNLIVENCQKVTIEELVRNAQKVLKKRLVESQLDALGIPVNLTTSKTRFNGERLWFECPSCGRRSGLLLREPYQGLLGCKKCLNVSNRKQRYKNMVECQL